MATSEQFEQDHAEAVEVATCIEQSGSFPECRHLLGGHIRQRAADHRALRTSTEFGVFGEVEIKQHWPTFVREQDVRRFEIAMENTAAMCMSQAVCKLTAQSKDSIDIGQLVQSRPAFVSGFG